MAREPKRTVAPELRELLEKASYEERVAAAGVALSYAAGMTERTGRDTARRIRALLRQHGEDARHILIRLNPPSYTHNTTPEIPRGMRLVDPHEQQPTLFDAEAG